MARTKVRFCSNVAEVIAVVAKAVSQEATQIVIDDDRGGSGCWEVKYTTEQEPIVMPVPQQLRVAGLDVRS